MPYASNITLVEHVNANYFNTIPATDFLTAEIREDLGYMWACLTDGRRLFAEIPIRNVRNPEPTVTLKNKPEFKRLNPVKFTQ